MSKGLEIRPIRPDDAERIIKATQYTSHETYYRRFHTSKSKFSPSELSYLTEVDGHDHFALIGVDTQEDRLAGVARFIRLSSNPRHAEMAIVIHDPFQRQGLARELLKKLSSAAGERGITHLIAMVQSDNFKMKRLIESLFPGAEVVSRQGMTVDYLLPLGVN